VKNYRVITALPDRTKELGVKKEKENLKKTQTKKKAAREAAEECRGGKLGGRKGCERGDEGKNQIGWGERQVEGGQR